MTQLNIKRQALRKPNQKRRKSCPFSAPNTPEIFNLLQTKMPNIQVDIDVQGEKKGDGLFEVILKVRAEANVDDESVYICELSYAGLFSINVPQDHIGPVLMIECPLILFLTMGKKFYPAPRWECSLGENIFIKI